MSLTNTSLRALRRAMVDTLRPSESDVWAGSPFEWIRRENISKNEAGTNFFIRLCELHLGDMPERTRINNVYAIRDKYFEVHSDMAVHKFSFNVPHNPPYDHFVAITIMPEDAAIWVFEKKALLKRLDPSNGYELTIDMDDIPDWVDVCGGTIERGLAAVVRTF